MILADTSAWIEYLRATGSDVHLELRRLLHRREPCSRPPTSSGWRSSPEPSTTISWRPSSTLSPGPSCCLFTGRSDYEDAAALYRTAVGRARPSRVLTDCLIAAVAIRNEVPVLQRDRDFETLARHTPLRLDLRSQVRTLVERAEADEGR